MAMAAEEKLLYAKAQTDGVFEHICKRPIDYRIKQQLLEQVVLTPTIALTRCRDFLWDALAGELKEEGHVVNLNDPLTEPPAQVEALSLDIIAGLVRAAGHDIPVSEYGPRADAAQRALQEAEEYTKQTGKEPPSLFSKQIIDALNKANLQIPHEYSEEEYEAQRKRNEKYSAFAPLGKAVDEYISVAQLASKHHMLVKTPHFAECGQKQLMNPKFIGGPSSNELVLFRIVATELGKTTFRPTIKGCLELARDPATVALRNQLSAWQTELAAGGESTLRSIQSEIKKANTALSKLSGVQTIGTLTTWLSVPVTSVELMLSLPPVLGISVGVVGKVSSGASLAISRKYKWAMYGNS